MPRACDFCYSDASEGWRVEAKDFNLPKEWHLDLCPLCWRMLVDVIGPVLHKVTHGQLLLGIQALMEKLDIDYDDLMKFGIEQVPGIEAPEEPLNYTALDRSFDDNVGMGNG